MSPNDHGITTFNVDITHVSNVILEVLNASGRRLWATLLVDAAPGHHRIVFDGRDRRGRPLRGTYFYRISTNGATVTRKITAAHTGTSIRFPASIRSLISIRSLVRPLSSLLDMTRRYA